MTAYLRFESVHGHSVTYAIADEADVGEVLDTLAEAAPEEVVYVPIRMKDQIHASALHVRPHRWDMWSLTHYDPDPAAQASPDESGRS